MRKNPNDYLFLISDDSEECRSEMVRFLQQNGIQNIISFENGEDTFNYFKGYEGSKECFFISDLHMGKLDGDQLYKKVRSLKKGLYVNFFIITSETERGKIIDMLSEGVSQFVLKPLSAKTVKRKLNNFVSFAS